MSLRARLLLSLGALLAVALIVSGALVVRATHDNLVQLVDDDLKHVTREDLGVTAPGPPGGEPGGRRFAVVAYSPTGQLLQSLPSGPASAPDPLPLVPGPDEAPLPDAVIVDRPSVDGSLSYRAVAVHDIQGNLVVLAAPLREVDRSITVLVRNLLLVGLAVLGIMLIVGWLIVRRGLQPLERMTATAERISAGDLSSRVGVRDDGSEVGRLGQAFDTMLDQIEGAFSSQQSALAAKDRSESKLRQFVADASHELRTPLTSLRGYSELYRAGGLSEEAALEQAMTRIGTESRRMGALVEDMLLLARLDQGRALRSDPVVLTDLVNDALNDARAVEPERPLNADVEDGVVVSGDEDRLRQVIGNLFTNVRVHTPGGSAVDVSLSSHDGVAALQVADHGPGVDPDHVEHVFDRFYRADVGRSRDRGGAGLGLSIAASVAAAHGGTIAYSSTEGGGATFTLTLPRA